MKFRIEQVFAATPKQLVDACCSADYIAAMSGIADLGAPVLEDQQRDGHLVRQRLKYSFQGKLPSAVTRVIDPEKLSWHELAEINTEELSAEFQMVTVHYQKFFTCDGWWKVSAQTKTTCHRVIKGELKVNSPVPFVGGQVERAIVKGLQDRLADEPRVFAEWLAQQ